MFSGRWFGYLQQALYHWFRKSARKAFLTEPQARTGKWEIFCIFLFFLFTYTPNEKKYFGMPPSSAFLDGLHFTGKLAWRVETLLSASLGSLCNAHVDFSLGITNDTSALARVKKDLPHLAL